MSQYNFALDPNPVADAAGILMPEVTVSGSSSAGTGMLGSILGGVAGSLVDFGLGSHSARKNRKFQERMANTQYQRAADDLEKAGLNRILALGNPAASPSGNAVTSSGTGQSVTAARMARKQEQLLDAELGKIYADTATAREAAKTQAEIARREHAAGNLTDAEYRMKALDYQYFTRLGYAPAEVNVDAQIAKFAAGVLPGVGKWLKDFLPNKKGAPPRPPALLERIDPVKAAKAASSLSGVR